MKSLNDKVSTLPAKAKIALGAALLAVGGVAGASVAHFQHPSIEMAPATVKPIAKLASASGIVAVRGRVAENFGNNFVLADGSGRTLIAADPNAAAPAVGSVVTVQGRVDDGLLRPSFLTDQAGVVTPVGPQRGPHGRPGRDGPGGPDRDGPGRDGPRHGFDGRCGPDGGPPPPPPGDRGAPPPQPANGIAPPPPPAGAPAPQPQPGVAPRPSA